jgi:type I restriction-modification system DNA methylase subunit
LFVKIFGYTLNPNPNYNLTTEYKNVKDAKKADGAILQDGKAIAVIELKGTNTTNLDKVEKQAFGYKNNQPDAVYVVTSNFEKIRFYIDNAVDFEEFNLFHLSLERFKILYLCLAKDNVFINLPKQIKDTSLEEEENVTKKLYKDYSTFRKELFQSIVKLNPDFDKLLLFKKTQKLLDRFLFIFFSEDGGLLPPNSIRSIIEQWVRLRDELDAYTPLYSRFKKYFGYMNTGHKGKNHDIFAYNGGLFAPDEILDNIKIDDTILYISTQTLSGYDFKSEVDVNILGHIFEHSLNEIEEVAAELIGEKVDKSKTKRKKDGVFYTPKYITKYIVENTVGKLCEERKTALGIDEAEYNKSRKGRKKETLKRLKKQLDDYRNWLLQITICDPACGSGAFLNQALEFLIDEHTYIDELETKLLGGYFVFPNIENAILENNLYGVDINEESVDIAKLSLWLRSAKPNRKLNSLNSNIKCGNSLIDDVNVAGDKAFDWKNEFPKVFEKGGFDVVIGNPPYVLCQPSNTSDSLLKFYKLFEVASYKIDLFHLFFEKSIYLLKNNGKLGFITPNTYLNNKYIKPLRSFILEHTTIDLLVNYKDSVFGDVGVDVATIILTKRKSIKNDIVLFESENLILRYVSKVLQKTWKKDEEQIFNFNQKLDIDFSDCMKLSEICSVTFGLQTKDKKTYVSSTTKGSDWEHCYTGKDISRYFLNESSLFFKNKIEEVKAGGSWNMDIHHSKKIVVRQVGNPEPIFAYDNYGYATLNTMYSIVTLDKTYSYYFLLSIFNSKLIKELFLSRYSDGKQLFPKVKGFQLKELPVKKASVDRQELFGQKGDEIMLLNKSLQSKINRFLKRLTDNLNIEKSSKKLQSFYDYDFKTFVAELKKKKVILSLTEQDEWEDYFNAYTDEIKALQTEINRIDKEIDMMVYELYGLNEEEIKIVENA